MAIIEEKKQSESGRSFSRRGIFHKRAAISRVKFEKAALKGRYIVPGGGGKIWGKQEIKKMIEEDFPKERFRRRISRKEFQKRIDELKTEKAKAKTGREKLEIAQKIKFYRRRFLR